MPFEHHASLKRLLSDMAVRCPGGRLPKDYFVFDTETSGVNPCSDRIVQVGFCLVRNGVKEQVFSQVVRQPDGFEVPEGAFKVHGIGRARMDKEGVPAEECFPVLHRLMLRWQEEGRFFLGHNMMAFDAPLWEESLRRLGITFRFGENSIIDTGMLVKGSQLGMYFNPDEPMRWFYRRVSEVRAAGVRWSLDKYCWDTFNLAGCGIGKERAHDAGVDCELAHHVFEKLQELSLNGK